MEEQGFKKTKSQVISNRERCRKIIGNEWRNGPTEGLTRNQQTDHGCTDRLQSDRETDRYIDVSYDSTYRQTETFSLSYIIKS